MWICGSGAFKIVIQVQVPENDNPINFFGGVFAQRAHSVGTARAQRQLLW